MAVEEHRQQQGGLLRWVEERQDGAAVYEVAWGGGYGG